MSAVVNLHGYEEAGVHRDLGANPFGPHSATPYLTVSHPGEPVVLVHAVLLTHHTMRPEALAEGIDVAVSGHEITIRLPGEYAEVVRLGNR